MLTLSDRIRHARELTDMTRAELARRVGVQPSAAVQWERPDCTSPSVANLAKIAVLTDVAFEWLATGRGAVHLATQLETPALLQGDFAHSIFEERVLQFARRTPRKWQEPLLRFLQDVFPRPTKKRVVKPASKSRR